MVFPFTAPSLLGGLLLWNPMGGKLGPPGDRPAKKPARVKKPRADERLSTPRANAEGAGLGVVPLEDLSEPPPSLEVPEPAQIEYAGQGPGFAAPLPTQPPVLIRTVPPQNRPRTAPEPERKGDAASAEPEGSWTNGLSVGAFIDTYAGVNVLLPDPGTQNALRAFDTANGFALHWAGVDAEYGGDVVGGTVSLRFGPSAAAYNGGDSDYGLQYVKQAYVTFSPRRTKGRLSFDLGKFDTLYGAEVADSQANFNYMY